MNFLKKLTFVAVFSIACSFQAMGISILSSLRLVNNICPGIESSVVKTVLGHPFSCLSVIGVGSYVISSLMSNEHVRNKMNIILRYGASSISQTLKKSADIFQRYISSKKEEAAMVQPSMAQATSCCTLQEQQLKEKANKSDEKGYKPLHYAAKNNDVFKIQELLAQGADINALSTNQAGATPLYLAVIHGNEQAATHLIAVHADVNIANKDNWTPLHAAVFCKNINVLQKLLDAGADYMACCSNGLTPLAWASRRNQTDMVERINNHATAQLLRG